MAFRNSTEAVMTIRWQDYIEKKKRVMMGKPIFKGTRLTVEHVLSELSTGMTQEELLHNYSTLNRCARRCNSVSMN
jgi:uncharacterized protein (DUF433 family)